MGRTVLVVIWVILATVFCGCGVILFAFVGADKEKVHKIARMWGRSIVRVAGIHVRVKNFSRLDPEKSYIFMSNHQSNFDIPVIYAYLDRRFAWLAKVELFSIPLFGRAMKSADYIPIDRTDRRAAIESLLRVVKTIQSGVSVVIFPEGTRSRNGELLPFKKGGFVIAVDSGISIVPIVIQGTHDVMPKKRLKILSGDVVVKMMDPVDTTGYSRKNKDMLIHKVRSIMLDAFDKRYMERREW